MLGSVALAFALALGLVLLIVRDMVTPIRALEQRSDEMARGELARPVPPSGEADEIGRLTFAFEEMRRALRDKLRTTESLNVDLEREVRRRTEVLEQRNVELRDALEKLRRAQDDLVRTEKLASMGRLVAGIAHEINNPVNAVINTLGPLSETIHQIALAKNEGDRRPDRRRRAGAGGRGDVARRRAGRGAQQGDRAGAAQLLARRRGDPARAQPGAQRRRHAGSAAPPPDQRARREADRARPARQRVRRADRSGVHEPGHQRRAGDRRSRPRRHDSRRRSRAPRGDVEIAIADDGPGIPPEVLPRIFDPFFTTKDVGEGSGLGLSIVHGIIERHGGRIRVDSRVGEGTTFRITLPSSGWHSGATASAAR